MSDVDYTIFGTVVLESGCVSEGCVAVKGEKVAAITSTADAPAGKYRIDRPGSFILPGVIDGHVHALNVPREGFLHTTRSAAAGGVTTIIDMPTEAPEPVVTVEILERKIERGEREALVDFALFALVQPKFFQEIDLLAARGIAGFKIFMSKPSTGDPLNDGALLEALSRIASASGLACVHAENDEIIRHKDGILQREGRACAATYLEARPPIAEYEAVRRVIDFTAETGTDLHLCHLSLPGSVQYVWKKRGGRRLTCETCPQYLVLSTDEVAKQGARLKCNPPVRTPEDRRGLWEEVLADHVDLIASDHAPHPLEAKSSPDFLRNRSGVPGVEMVLPLMYSEGVIQRGLPLESLAKMLSGNPARRFGLYPRKGCLLPGSDADLVIFDPGVRWEVDGRSLLSSAGWSAYEGMSIEGKTYLTMVRGRIVYQDGAILEQPGFGRFVQARVQRDGSRQRRDGGPPVCFGVGNEDHRMRGMV